LRATGPIILATLAIVSPAAGQDREAPSRGVELRLEAIQSPAWSLEVRTDGFLNRKVTYESGLMAGLRLGVSPLRYLAAFGSAQWDGGGFGDTSGQTAIEAGLDCRLSTGTPLVPRVMATFGRFSETGGVHFGYWSAGAGVDLHLRRAFAVGVEVRRVDPLSAGTNLPGAQATVSAAMTRLHLSVVLGFPFGA
jgi:hypothetical protein